MDSYEMLLIEAERRDYFVKEMPLKGSKGRINGKRIAIDERLSTVEKTCVLQEELAHGELTSGNILDQSKVQNRRQERKARMLAAQRRADLNMIAEALRRGLRSQEEIADFLCVTEEFLCAAIEGYRQKYGQYVRVGDDILLLEPTVGLLSMKDDF